MANQTTKIKNGIIVLPKELKKSWKGAEVFIFPSDDTLVVKKIQRPLEADWQKYEEKLTKGRKKISSKIIDETVSWARTKS